MSLEKLQAFAKTLPDAVELMPLDAVANGNISINKKGVITVPVAFRLEELGSKMTDLRAALSPFCYENKIVPLICFIDLEKLP